MKILFINHNGGSPYHGPNLRTYYAAKQLIQKGHSVRIVSSSFSHKYINMPKVKDTITSEIIDGIEYKWIKCIKYKNLIQRVISHFQFGFRLLYNKKKIATKPDRIIFSGPPPEIFIFSWIYSLIIRKPIYSDIRDIWPKTQLEMSIFHWVNPYTYLSFLSQILIIKFSKKIISPLPGIKNHIIKFGRIADIWIIENGIEIKKIDSKKNINLQIMKNSDLLNLDKNIISIKELKQLDKFIVGYSGAFDRDNDIDSLILAAKNLSDKKNILFLIIGDGLKRNDIIKKTQNLNNVLICNRVSSKDVPVVINIMDVCFCGLKPKNIYKYGVSLAKTFEYMLAKKPILWMIDAYNNPITESGSGIKIKAGDSDALTRAITNFNLMDKKHLSRLGLLGYEYLKKYNNYEALGEKWNLIVK